MKWKCSSLFQFVEWISKSFCQLIRRFSCKDIQWWNFETSTRVWHSRTASWFPVTSCWANRRWDTISFQCVEFGKIVSLPSRDLKGEMFNGEITSVQLESVIQWRQLELPWHTSTECLVSDGNSSLVDSTDLSVMCSWRDHHSVFTLADEMKMFVSISVPWVNLKVFLSSHPSIFM